MNTTSAATKSTVSRGRSTLVWIVVAVLIVVAFAAIAPSEFNEDAYLNPRSSRPEGIKALVLLLEKMGAEVDIVDELPLDDHDVAFIAGDWLGGSSLEAVDEWVKRGGALVLADPYSPLNPYESSVDSFDDFVLEDSDNPDKGVERNCAVPALSKVKKMSHTFETLRPDGAAVACFGNVTEGQVAIGTVGLGTIVVIGAAEPFMNDNIDEHDNAALIAALLAPMPGTKVGIISDASVGEGEETLSDLIPDRFYLGCFQLCIGFLVYAWWRSRRLGSPVSEALPVEISASELVRAMGRLLHRGSSRDQVAQLLREDMRRRLTYRLSLGPGFSAEELTDLASERTGVSIERLRAVLVPFQCKTDSDLVALGAAIEKIDQEVGNV